LSKLAQSLQGAIPTLLFHVGRGSVVATTNTSRTPVKKVETAKMRDAPTVDVTAGAFFYFICWKSTEPAATGDLAETMKV
jgi:hypothetical protein